MTEGTLRILMIEDDSDYVQIIRLCLDEPDAMGMTFEVERVDRLEAGLDRLAAARFDAVLLDLMLPDSRGLETVSHALAGAGSTPILVMTSQGEEAVALEALRLGAQDFIVKASWDSRLLKRAVWYAVARRRMLAQVESVIRGTPDAMVVVDLQGLMRFANPAAEHLLGARADELEGRPFPFSASAGPACLLAVGPDKERCVELRAAAIDWKGAPAVLASLRDITELQRLERLKADIRERRKTDRLKDELLATVSHELRTPLTIVRGAVASLREGLGGALTRAQAEVVRMAEKSLNRLSRMITNLLDLSRLESGQAKVYRRRVPVAELFDEIMLTFERPARDRGLVLAKAVEPGAALDADPELVGQVLANLVDNALRYARSRVELRARREGETVKVEVVDDGPGIAPERVGDLFNKYVQLQRAVKGSGYKGTGLGLAIAQEALALHGSRLAYEPRAKGGAVFGFVLRQSTSAGAALS